MTRWFAWLLAVPFGTYVGLAICGLGVWAGDGRGVYIGLAVVAVSLWALQGPAPATAEQRDSSEPSNG